MSHFETTTTVGGHGEIHLAAVPFIPGTEVDVVVIEKSADHLKAQNQLSRLFAALDCARNSQPVGSLRRDELYDRNNLH
jgi:hypothetical protein